MEKGKLLQLRKRKPPTPPREEPDPILVLTHYVVMLTQEVGRLQKVIEKIRRKLD